MLPAYKIRWSKTDEQDEKVAKTVSAWSSQNWIAFTTGCTWKQPSKNTLDTVFIINPNQPWETFPVYTGHGCAIIHIEWEENGSRFLTVDTNGMAKLWINGDNLINQWECAKSFDVGEGDKVKKVIWINSRSKYKIDVDKIHMKKDIFKKFIPNKIDSAMNSHSENNDCLVAVTSCGLFKVIVLQDDNKPNIYTVKLGSIKFNVVYADMCINENGKFFVAVQSDPCTIELFTVTCKEAANGIDLTADVWPCIVPHLSTKDPDFSDFQITNIKCVSIGASDQVLISSKSESASCVQVFEIKKEHVLLHPCFARPPTSQQNSDTCVCVKTVKLKVGIQTIQVTNLQFVNLGKSNDSSLSPKVIILDSNGTFHVYSLYNWSQMLKPSLIESLQQDQLSCATFSPCDHCLFTITNSGAILIFMLPHYSVCQEKFRIKNVVNLLHYCLVESYIPWDVMLYLCSVEKQIVDQCYQVFMEECAQANQLFQHLFVPSFLNFKAMFYHIYKDYCGVVECHNMMLLHSVYHFVTNQLQSDKESAFFEVVQKICTSSKEIDITKIVPMIDTKDLSIFLSSDSSHRPIIQWVTDYAIHFVRLILSRNHHGQIWKLVMKYFDSSCFLQLRQLLLIFYVLYQKNPTAPHIQPIFVTMASSIDITAQLFKLVSKLQQLSNGESIIEIGMTDLPFSNLPLMYLEYPSDDPKSGVLSTTTITQSMLDVDHYEFQLKSDPWDYIHRVALENPLSRGVSTVNTSLRQIYDGINFSPSSLIQGEVVKQCCRCGCFTIHLWNPSRSYNVAWNVCWDKHCFCGGLWKKVEWHV